MCTTRNWRNGCEDCEEECHRKKVEFFACPWAEFRAGTQDVRIAFGACGFPPEEKTQVYFGNLEAMRDRPTADPYRGWTAYEARNWLRLQERERRLRESSLQERARRLNRRVGRAGS